MQTFRNLSRVCALLAVIYGQAQAAESRPSSAPPTTEPEEITVDAQRLEIYLDRKMSAIGDAEVHRNDQVLYGDRIDYDLINEELHISGNSRIEQPGKTVVGQDLRMKLGEREGEMTDVVFTMREAQATTGTKPASSGLQTKSTSSGFQTRPGSAGFLRGDAKSISFDGPEKESFKDARYTTCPAGVDDWYLRAKDLEFDHSSDTATAHHASVEFKGVPILYTPWIDFSTNNQRKSGFLAPYYEHSNLNGFGVSVPYYWNIAPNMDATITPRYLSKRGEEVGVDFRYLQQNYSGRDIVQYLPNDQQTNNTRWLADLKHRQDFGNGWSASYDLERVSDDKFLSDLSTNIVATSTVVLPQTGVLSYNTSNWAGNWNFNAIAQQYQTLDGQSYPYFRLPEFNLTGNREWDVATGNMYAQWVDFEQSSYAPPSVTGNRFTTYPSLSLPFTSSYGYITPKLGVHSTTYSLRGDTAFTLNGQPANYQSSTVTLPIFSVDSGVYFDRNFRVVHNNYTQTLEPRLFYVYIPYQNQSYLPVFDSAQADLNMTTLFTENQFAGNDRVNNANQLSMAVTSRLIDEKTGTQRLAATIGQRFYFVDQKVTIPGTAPRTQNSSDIITSITAQLLNHWSINSNFQYNTGSGQTDRSDFGARYNPGGGRLLNMSYRYTQGSLEQVDFSGEWPLANHWYGLGRWNYSISGSQNIESIAGAEYDGGCWQLRTIFHSLYTATAKTNTSFIIQLELSGLTSIGSADPFAVLKRNIPGYTPSGMIADPVEEP